MDTAFPYTAYNPQDIKECIVLCQHCGEMDIKGSDDGHATGCNNEYNLCPWQWSHPALILSHNSYYKMLPHCAVILPQCDYIKNYPLTSKPQALTPPTIHVQKDPFSHTASPLSHDHL